MEVEAKFTVPDEATFQRLCELAGLAGFALSAARTVETRDQYFDSADGRFLAAGYACRLRAEDNAYIVTLKGMGNASGAVHRRDEREVNLPSPDMDPEHWPDGPARWLGVELAAGAGLQPLFELNQRRSRRNVMDDERLVAELSLDEVKLAATRLDEGAPAGYFELEAEIKGAGTEDDLERLVQVLQRDWGLIAEKRSKFERALAELREKDPALAALPEPGSASSARQLSPEERVALERFTLEGKRPLARRAAAVLGWAAGQSSKEIAQGAGLSTGRVRYWVRSFRARRMGIFAKGTKKRGPKPRSDDAGTARADKRRKVSLDGDTAAPLAPEPSEMEPGTGPDVDLPVAPTTNGAGDLPMREAAQAAQPEPAVEPLPAVQQPLDPCDPMAEAGRKIMYLHFQRVCEHEEGTRAGEDPESLHDMRVATRRLRAAYLLFAPYFDEKKLGRFNRRLRQTGRVLGAVRDLDVLLGKGERYAASRPAEDADGLAPLLADWHVQRDRARNVMIEFLDSGSYHRFKNDFATFLSTPGAGALPIPSGEPVAFQVRHVAPRLIAERYEGVRAYEVLFPGAPLLTYHELRIACKKLRYALEFFREVLGDGGSSLIKKVVGMQDLLGDLQDATVAEGLIATFLARQAQQHVHQTGQVRLDGIAAYLNAQWATQRDLLARFPEMWAELVGYEFRKSLNLAVAVL